MIGGSAFFRVRLELSKYYRQVFRLVGLDFSTEFGIWGGGKFVIQSRETSGYRNSCSGGLRVSGLRV